MKFSEARSVREARLRLNAVWNISKTKMICEGGEELDDKAMNDEDYLNGNIKKRGGCGHRQPVIRKEGLALTASFKASQHDVRENLR